MRFIRVLLALAIVTSISGCIVVEDQEIASPNARAKINPYPIPRDFRGQNQSHLILVGVLDSGVDYNHPALVQQIHFDLDGNGNPRATGWDYTGGDGWPAPYLARTEDENDKLSDEVREISRRKRETIKKLLRVEPRLSEFLDETRSVEFEQLSSAHGTHVAGLLAAGDLRIGLIPYRVLANSKATGGTDDPDLITRQMQKSIVGAIEHAARKGVRVINISMGFQLPVESQTPAFEEFAEAFRKALRSHPQIAFVVAAGNDGKKVATDGSALPCGMNEPNLVCVTALSRNGKAASFSNQVPAMLLQLAASGEKMRSAIPWNFCSNEKLMGVSGGMSSHAIEVLAKHLTSTCFSGERGFADLSGTSMATPVAAHEVAKVMIEDPGMTGAAAIQEVIRKFPRGIVRR